MGLFNLVDILVILIILWGSYRGFKKGLIKSFGGIVALLASFFVATNYKETLANYLDRQSDIIPTIGQVIAKTLPLPNFSFEANYLSTAIASAGVNDMTLPYFLKKILVKNIDQLLTTGNHMDIGLAEIIAYGITGMFLKGLCFLMLFVGTWLLVKIAVAVLSTVFSIPPLSIFNRLSGAVIGLVTSIIITVFVSGLFYSIVTVSTIQNNSTLTTMIYSSNSYPLLLNLYTIISNTIW